MSAQALQRVVVRMLHDPGLVDRVFAGQVSALEDVELSERERTWLLRPDRRAFATDPFRRSRSLQGLIEEYPASFALARAGGFTWEELDAFFSSRRFHDAVQSGGSLALAFGEHLLDLAQPHGEREAWLDPVARLERGLARVRRRIPHAIEHEGGWSLTPQVELLAPPRGTLATHQLVSGRLGDPRDLDFESLLDTARLEGLRLPPRGEEAEQLLLVLAGDLQVRIEPLTPELFAILEATRGGIAHDELVARCCSLGASEDQAEEILRDFALSGELLSPEGAGA